MDNLDRNIKPRHQTLSTKTISVHWSNVIAVKDRCAFSMLDDEIADAIEFDTKYFLPDKDSYTRLIENVAIIAGRILVKYLPAFSKYSSLISNIQHKYSIEMSTRSQVVPLGLILKNPAKTADMVEILDNLHQYVPSSSTSFEDNIPGQNPEIVQLYCFHKILCFGDQLTVERIRSAKAIRSNSEDGLYQLQGLLPGISDWHAKVSFLGVIYSRLYSNDSKSNGGTLSQLRYLINRTDVPSKPKENVNAAEDFLEAVVFGHLVAAALHFFNMQTVHDSPSSHYFDSIENEHTSIEAKKELFHSAIVDMITAYVNFTPFDEDVQPQDHDYVRVYAKEVFSLGILLLEFNGGVRQGDGEPLENIWRYLLLIFHAKRKTKYALEAFILLAQANILLSPRLREQLLYSCFINTKGLPGRNIPVDLHVEHVNSIVKSAIYNQVSNLSPTRTSQCTGILSNVCEQFDKVTRIHKENDTHSAAKLEADINWIVKELHETSKVSNYTPKRKHTRFNTVSGSLINLVKADKVKFIDWMKKHFKNLS